MTDELLAVLDQEAQRTDAEGQWPETSMKTLAESGLLGLTLTTEAGGGGAGMRSFAEVTENLDVPAEAPVLQGRGQAARPKAAPVFANEPVIVRRPACGPRRL